tara:strand:+ start:5235 stop:5840 length:606 start_codon:yes stop_codon:yes gene_type:complete
MSSLHQGVIRETVLPELTEAALSLEANMSNDDQKRLYVLLTDTGTRFSRISKLVTGDPYNHVSVSFDDTLETIYTYALRNANGFKGGLKKENLEVLKGSRYSLYELPVTTDIYGQVVSKVKEMEEDLVGTGYNHLALINAIFKKEIFESEMGAKMICSQFVVEILKQSGVELFKNRASSTVRPYDFVRSKLLRFVRRGKFR